MKPIAYARKTKYGDIFDTKKWGRIDRPLYAIPKGYKLVPIEPTKEMVSAGCCTNLYVPDTWEAMIEAAPSLEDI